MHSATFFQVVGDARPWTPQLRIEQEARFDFLRLFAMAFVTVFREYRTDARFEELQLCGSRLGPEGRLAEACSEHPEAQTAGSH